MQDQSSQRGLHEPGSLSTSTFEANCRRCGQPFRATGFEVVGVTLKTTICHACSEQLERAELAAKERSRQQLARRQAEAREDDWEELCPKEFRLASERGGLTDLWRLELEQPRLKELLAWNGPRGLIIRGPSGKCKTRALWRLVRRLFLEGRQVRFFTAGQFDRKCRDVAGNFTLSDWFNGLARADVFCLDDLGKGAWTPSTEATWFDLVDERTREARPIFITTNDTGDTLAQRLSPERAEMLIRRLRDYCDQIVFK